MASKLEAQAFEIPPPNLNEDRTIMGWFIWARSRCMNSKPMALAAALSSVGGFSLISLPAPLSTQTLPL
ncbi:hypothetical protein FRC12_003123 [Ceratobasidium sp. 428]|nr:hypothetical protein FRC12_003123 [Ceratobasidium sp. 428]